VGGLLSFHFALVPVWRSVVATPPAERDDAVPYRFTYDMRAFGCMSLLWRTMTPLGVPPACGARATFLPFYDDLRGGGCRWR